MLRKVKHISNYPSQGHIAVEFLLMFAMVVVIAFIALSPDGFFKNQIDESLNEAVDGIEIMALNVDIPYE